MAKLTKIEWVEKEIEAQKKWIEEHGGNLAGYVEHYGSASDTDHFGDGGEAIYQADLGHLTRLVDQHTRLRAQSQFVSRAPRRFTASEVARILAAERPPKRERVGGGVSGALWAKWRGIVVAFAETLPEEKRVLFFRLCGGIEGEEER